MANLAKVTRKDVQLAVDKYKQHSRAIREGIHLEITSSLVPLWRRQVIDWPRFWKKREETDKEVMKRVGKSMDFSHCYDMIPAIESSPVYQLVKEHVVDVWYCPRDNAISVYVKDCAEFQELRALLRAPSDVYYLSSKCASVLGKYK